MTPTLSPSTLASVIDHTLLKPDACEREIVALCHDAIEFRFGAVCVNPGYIALAAKTLAGTNIGIVSVVSFPHGQDTTERKVAEATGAVEDGATEIDMVANRQLLLDGKYAEYAVDIREVRKNLLDSVILKVIIEAGLLDLTQTSRAVEAVIKAGAQFVKTSTGHFGGCTPEMVNRLVSLCHGRAQVKASGGIRTSEDCRLLLDAGATRIGTSAGVAIMKALRGARATG